MLEILFPSFTSQKPDEIPIFGTFLAKFSIFGHVLEKIGYFRFGHVYDVILPSYVRCLYLFWYV